jgi:hypothetical protein
MRQAEERDTETILAERPQAPQPAATPAEPATSRALWPTFMRRTLCEEALRREPTRA